MIVIKVGGSLMDVAADILSKFKEGDYLIIPGGGIFADAVRQSYSRFKISEEAAHRMAILAMDIYGIFLSDISGIPARDVPEGELPAILLPYRLFGSSLKPSWQITSDSIAYYIGCILEADEVVLLKRTDGIFGKKRLKAEELKKMEQKVVDSYLASLIQQFKLPCRVCHYSMEVCTEIIP